MTLFPRPIVDVVRELLHDEAYAGHDRILVRYLKPDLLILDDMGMKQLAKRFGGMAAGNHPAATWGAEHADDEQSSPGGLGETDWRHPSATAILARLLENSEVIQMTGKSHRLRGHR